MRLGHMLLSLSILCATAQIIQAAPPEGARYSHWQEDLDFFETNLPQKHIDFYELMPRGKFEGEMAGIKNSAPQLSDAEIILQLTRLTASLGIGHTGIGLPQEGPLAFHRYPFSLRWFPDGLLVVGAAPEYENALGARVGRIGGMTPEQLEKDLAPYISYENETWLREQAPKYMVVAELLQHLRVADTNGDILLTLAKTNGKSYMLKIPPANWNTASTNQIYAMDFLHVLNPLYRKNPHADYWYEFLPATRTLYLQYTVCENDPQNPFENFTKKMFAFADSHSVERLIVDLRFNGGGNSEVINPLLRGIEARPSLNTKGHLFVLIGPDTFSSGEIAVEEFHNTFQRFNDLHFNAVLVGEPTGGKPNCYGDVLTFKLPHSGLLVRYSTKHFELSEEDDPPSREPDILVKRSWKDYLTGYDPVLETALTSPFGTN